MKISALLVCLLFAFQIACPNNSGKQNRDLDRFLKDFQNDFESSSRSFLEHFEGARIPNYPAFEENVEKFFAETRMGRRMFLRPAIVSVDEKTGTANVNAELEIRFARNGTEGSASVRAEFSLEKQNGRWKIVQASPNFYALFDRQWTQ